MRRGIERRLSRLEAFLPLTVERFLIGAHQHAVRCGVNIYSAIELLAKDLSPVEVDSMLVELADGLDGSNRALEDRLRCETLAASYPDETKVADEARRGEA
jgi:hypothetical protein